MKVDILEFYAGDTPNSHGEYFKDILSYDNVMLEQSHTFIQWLFPLPQPSRAVPGSPIITQRQIEVFNRPSYIKLRHNMLRALRLMLDFYGLEVKNNKIIKAENYDIRASEWQFPNDHNYLRITRIIASLAILGQSEYARMLYDCIIKIYNESPKNFSPSNKVYWDAAVEGILI